MHVGCASFGLTVMLLILYFVIGVLVTVWFRKRITRDPEWTFIILMGWPAVFLCCLVLCAIWYTDPEFKHLRTKKEK